MDPLILKYYGTHPDQDPNGHFHDVIALHQGQGWIWAEIKNKVPTLSRGWFEFSQLSAKDRIEFSKEFWLSKLPFNPNLKPFLDQFFSGIEDVGIFLVQPRFDDPYEPHMVYSLKGTKGFFKGYPPADEKQIVALKEAFPSIIFPSDYLNFLQIHDGFSKTTDTGIIRSSNMRKSYYQFQAYVTAKETMVMLDEVPVDPMHLIPFYDSFGLPFFQCFWDEWYPEEEMGNVYYSGVANTISRLVTKDTCAENMAFTTFSDWLMFYLETLDTL